MTELSVIIVTIKNKEDIICLSKFQEEDFDDYEIIIRRDEGIAKARNEGVKESNGDKIIFIDDDADPIEGYLQAAANVLEQNHVVAGKVIHPGEGLISRMATHYPTDDESKYVDSLVGCNMGYRKEVFKDVGYFDEGFLWGHEESEFIERVKKKYPIFYDPEMCVIHPYAEGVLDYWKKQYRFGPGDIYRAKQNGKTDSEIIIQLLNPLWYFNSDLMTLPIYVVGSICKSISRLRALRNYD